MRFPYNSAISLLDYPFGYFLMNKKQLIFTAYTNNVYEL